MLLLPLLQYLCTVCSAWEVQRLIGNERRAVLVWNDTINSILMRSKVCKTALLLTQRRRTKGPTVHKPTSRTGVLSKIVIKVEKRKYLLI